MAEHNGRPKTLPLPTPGIPPVPTTPRPERFTLENRLRVLAVHRPGLPQVAIRLLVPAGSAAEPAEHPGTATLVGSLLTEGTERFSAIELNERLDSLGASLGARVGHDFAEVDLMLLSETLEEGLPLLAEVVARATFPEREVERNRAETLDALEARLDEPANVADDHLSAAVFGQIHPYGRLSLGTTEGVRSVQREVLQRYYARQYRPEGSVLVMAGDLGGNSLQARLEAAFAGWVGAVEPVIYPPPLTAPVSEDPLLVVEWGNAAQAELRVAGIGLSRASPDWVPASVANYILGGSTITGRLGANLREEKGWTYGVRSGFASTRQPGGWVVETAVDAEAAADALDEIDRELRRMVAEPVSQEELSRATEALILSLPRAFETPARVVSRLATIEAFNLDPAYWDEFPHRVRRVTPDEILRIAGEHFAPERLAHVTVGPPLPARKSPRG